MVIFFLLLHYIIWIWMIFISMEFKKHINIRLSESQLKRLLSAMLKEKVNLSTLVRNILHSYLEANSIPTEKELKREKEK